MGTDDAATIAVEVRDESGTTIVSVGGELDFGTAAPLRARLSDLAQQGTGAIVLDLAGLRFIDSIGLGLLVQAKRRFAAEGLPFEVRNPATNVSRVFETSGLSELFGLGPHDH